MPLPADQDRTLAKFAGPLFGPTDARHQLLMNVAQQPQAHRHSLGELPQAVFECVDVIGDLCHVRSLGCFFFGLGLVKKKLIKANTASRYKSRLAAAAKRASAR